MKGKLLGLLLGALPSAPVLCQPTFYPQEVRLELEDLARSVHSYHSELDLVQERLRHLEESMEVCVHKVPAAATNMVQEKRIAFLEKTLEACVADLKKIKAHEENIQKSVGLCQDKLAALEGHLQGELKTLKSTLQSIVGILEPEPTSAKVYVVKEGDSLGQIAHDHKVEVRVLKKLNGLTSDTIRPRQKLKLP